MTMSACLSSRATRGSMLALLATALLVGLGPSDARGAWPPPKDATPQDMKNPANWPDDPGYGFAASETPSKRASGQWEFYSFIPDRSPGASALRSAETASGMSIDLAWRHTTGDPRVVIAVLDSGIKWEEGELLEKAWLNTGELKNHKPRLATGESCGGTGALAGFDCNGDGVLTVSDYAEDPAMTPAASDGHPHGDRNNNGVLDAGDIILNFSDGIDDDANGYVDDISGWDFLKDDNDPYEDTRFYHQTREARMSVGATNNGQGSAGSCPHCMYFPLRVGDSFIVNAQDFAQGVMYAADIGASVVQEALGTMNQTSFSQAAMSYAYRKGLTIVASMADENSRHHNMPAVANHTLPAHAICRYGSQDSTTAVSFQHFNSCSNFGGHGFISVSAEPCASEAVGWLSGMVGLMYSAAVQSELTPPLSGGEARQIVMMTADDINAPESQTEDSPYFWSTPGFDQRFGYGRANANRMVEWVLERRIPPAIELASPEWYTVFYADRVDAPIEIRGTVSAKRANSFDYVVEWAAGVQPADADFKPIPQSAQQNVSPTSTAGDNQPLAVFDVRDLEIDNPRGPDETETRENRYTITVRVRATAHYGGTIADVPGELRRTYYVVRDPSLLPGFPIRMTTHTGGTASGESSPKLADIDGDGLRDIVSANADGELHVWKVTPSGPVELPGFPYFTERVNGLNPAQTAKDPGVPDHTSAPGFSSPDGIDPDVARETILSAPAVADIDGDGKPEIAFATWEGTIHLVDADGKAKPGWPVRLPRIPSCPLDPTAERPEPCMDVEHRVTRGSFGAPAMADMNRDGKLEIVVAAFDGWVRVLQANGEPLSGWPVQVHYTGTLAQGKETSRIFTTPALDDVTGDGIPEVLVGSNERLGAGENAGAIYLIDGRGNAAGSPPYLPNWPVTMTSMALFPTISEGVTNSGALGDFDGDGIPEVVMHGTASSPLILPRDPGTQAVLSSLPSNALPERPGQDGNPPERGLEPTAIFGELSNAETPDTMFPLFAQPSIGDLNQDGTLDLIASGGSLSMALNMFAGAQSGGIQAQHLLAMWDGKTGKMFPGSPVVLEDYTFFNNQAIADLNGDDYPEVITGTAGYYIRAVDACGREAEGFPKFTGQWIIGTAAVGDIDGDQKLELVASTRSGWLYAWDTEASVDNVIQWESFHHDNRNTGAASTELDQGVYLKAATPLDCYAAPAAEEPAAPSDDSGCGCRVVQAPRPTSAVALGLLAGALWMARKRKKG